MNAIEAGAWVMLTTGLNREMGQRTVPQGGRIDMGAWAYTPETEVTQIDVPEPPAMPPEERSN